MSLENHFHNLLDDFIPSLTDQLFRNVIFSGDLSEIENFKHIIHLNIFKKEDKEENSINNTNNKTIKNIEKD